LRLSKIIFRISKKSEPIEIESFIWCNNINIAHIRRSKHIIIDATYHIPYTFCQCLILMYKDIILAEKYPAFFIVMNKINYKYGIRDKKFFSIPLEYITLFNIIFFYYYIIYIYLICDIIYDNFFIFILKVYFIY